MNGQLDVTPLACASSSLENVLELTAEQRLLAVPFFIANIQVDD